MEETDEKQEGGAGSASHGSDSAGMEEAELRAEEESAEAMDAEVPHPPGFDNPGQEQHS